MDLRPRIRQQIAELEEQEWRLRNADRAFWDNPRHDFEADSDYEERRKRLASLRKELSELYDELVS